MQKNAITKELQLLLRQANIEPNNVEKHLQQRATQQMREYLKVMCYRLDRDFETTAVDSHLSEQILQLLRTIHQH